MVRNGDGVNVERYLYLDEGVRGDLLIILQALVVSTAIQQPRWQESCRCL